MIKVQKENISDLTEMVPSIIRETRKYSRRWRILNRANQSTYQALLWVESASVYGRVSVKCPVQGCYFACKNNSQLILHNAYQHAEIRN